MSLPFIPETVAEVHRLAIAGSNLAADDFRLKKLIPSLEGLAAKAPIFGRIATAVKAVTEEKDPAAGGRALLDLSSLLTAIQYTQSPYEVKGDLTPLTTAVTEWTPTVVTHRSLAAVVNALTSTGEGRLDTVRDALDRGIFKDLRLMAPALKALSDNYGEMAALVAREVVPAFGKAVIPMLLEGFDPKGGNSHARRLAALCRIDPVQGRSYCRSILEEAAKEVKLAVIEGLTGSEEDLDVILDLTKEKSVDVRRAAIKALQGIQVPKVIEFAKKAMKGKDSEEGALLAVSLANPDLNAKMLAEAQELTAKLSVAPAAEDKDGKSAAIANERHLRHLLLLHHGTQEPAWADLAASIFNTVPPAASEQLRDFAGDWLYQKNTPEFDAVLYGHEKLGIGTGIGFSFLAACRRLAPSVVYGKYSDLVKLGKKKSSPTLVGLLQGNYQNTWIGGYGSLSLKHLGIQLDSRWLLDAIQLGHLPGVVSLAKPGDKEASEYFRSLKDEQLTYNVAKDVVVKLAEIDPDNTPAFMKRCVQLVTKNSTYAYYHYYILSVIPNLPARLLPEIEALRAALPEGVHENFDEYTAQLRHKAAQEANP